MTTEVVNTNCGTIILNTPMGTVVKTALFLTVAFAAFAFAQEDIHEMTLEQLLEVPVSIASRIQITTRESPGIVTLITAEEIENSGARDLIDLLRMVPGFDFAADVWGTVGPGIRGVYNSGKISFLVDGNEFVERLYSNVLFGNHFPVDQILRIEIIRGPGSVLYGGTAEMAVVNIITKKAKEINGASVSIVNGQMAETYARRNLNVLLGKQWKTDWEAYGSFSLEGGNRSDQTYTDAFGTSYAMKDFSDIDSFFFNGGSQFKRLSIQMLIDRYALEERDHYNVVIPEPTTDHFDSTIFNFKYEHQLSEKLTITPHFNFSRQIPWHIDNKAINQQFATFYKATCDRYTANVVASYEMNPKMNLFGGAEYYYDAIEYDKDSYNVNTPVNLEQNYNDVAAFGQTEIRSSAGNFTVGARYEKQNQFGSAFVPRISYTRLFERWHFKALYSQSYRAPNIEALRFNRDIKPEKTRALEFETGYRISDRTFVSANIFDVATDDPILYVFQNNQDNYFNFEKTGSRGLETEWRLRDQWGYVMLNYSYYHARSGSIPPYQPIDYQQNRLINDDAFLGLPQHKFTAQAAVRVSKRITVNPSLVQYSKRYGYQSVDSQGALILETFDPVTLANIFVSCKGLLGKNVDFGLGVFDLLGEDYKFVASYNSGHAPLPGPTRELLLRVSFHLPK